MIAAFAFFCAMSLRSLFHLCLVPGTGLVKNRGERKEITKQDVPLGDKSKAGQQQQTFFC